MLQGAIFAARRRVPLSGRLDRVEERLWDDAVLDGEQQVLGVDGRGVGHLEANELGTAKAGGKGRKVAAGGLVHGQDGSAE